MSKRYARGYYVEMAGEHGGHLLIPTKYKNLNQAIREAKKAVRDSEEITSEEVYLLIRVATVEKKGGRTNVRIYRKKKKKPEEKKE